MFANRLGYRLGSLALARAAPSGLTVISDAIPRPMAWADIGPPRCGSG